MWFSNEVRNSRVLFVDIEKFKHISSISGKMTHGHSTADASCIAGSLVINYALNNMNEEDCIPASIKEIEKVSEEFNKILEKTKQLVELNIHVDQAIPEIGEGWVAEEALALVLFCVLKFPNDFKSAMRLAVNITSDSDSVGCIAGGLLGAKHGFAGFIPEEWVESLKPSFKEKLNDFYEEMTKY